MASRVSADANLNDEQFGSNIPSHAMLFGKRRVRVLNYEGRNHFTVLDGSRQVFTHRDNLTFVKNPKRRQ